jgi:hypothetical protein
MKNIFVFMQINQSFSDLFHDLPALVLIEFPNEVFQVSISAVLEDKNQIFFFIIKKQLSAFMDVGMFQKQVHLSSFFCILFGLLGHRNHFDCVIFFIEGLCKIDLTK